MGKHFTGTISDCYAIATVTGQDNTGGLLGKSRAGTISNCYAAGSVTGLNYTGGLVGYAYEQDTSYASCFWDCDVNPTLDGIGNRSDPNVIGRSTAQMQTESTFTDAGWDFVGESANGTEDIWTLHEGQDYPKLVWKLVNFVGWYEVDFADFAFLASRWMDTNCADANSCDGADLDFSDAVDAKDLKIFSNYWLEGIE